MASSRWPLLSSLILLASVADGERIVMRPVNDEPGQGSLGEAMKYLAEVDDDTANSDSLMEVNESESMPQGGWWSFFCLTKALPQYRFFHKYRFLVPHHALGQGAYGTVWRGVEIAGEHRKLAVKQEMLRSPLCMTCRSRSQLDMEYELQRSVSNVPFVLPVLNATYQWSSDSVEEYYYLAFPLAKGVAGAFDLRQYMAMYTRSRLSMEEIQLILAQLAIAVRGIHMAGVMHKDLKLENVLIDGVLKPDLVKQWDRHADNVTGVPKVSVADFGIAEKFRLPTSRSEAYGDGSVAHAGGTTGYMAPEVIEAIGAKKMGRSRTKPIKSSADWFSYAVVACSIVLNDPANIWDSPCNFHKATSDSKIRFKVLLVGDLMRQLYNNQLFVQRFLEWLSAHLLRYSPEERFSSFNMQDTLLPYSNQFWKHDFWKLKMNDLGEGTLIDFRTLAAAGEGSKAVSDVATETQAGAGDGGWSALDGMSRV
eukprot:gb/GFBE01038612.1/.p1 GENE.gb/GFBE01038612.1/~~gb/GFBE01038612.1/.p1  ORF type:complete len:480 (+),score=85.29 gb/GFBE01038612.1/:1-1440(+)